MQLFYLMLFMASIMLNAYAFTVVSDPYKNLVYDEITVYDLTKEKREQCYCYEY